MKPPLAPQSLFSVRFGGQGGSGDVSALALPVLRGENEERIFSGLRPAGTMQGFSLFASRDWLIGWRSIDSAADGSALGRCTRELYGNLLGLGGEMCGRLARIWNYVPRINATSFEGLENYRVFCRERAAAFDAAAWSGALPAASAVGCDGDALTVIFAAARERPVARENPEQVPAYLYPPDYGPRSPSFSRAMQVWAEGRRWTFVSGTAAIKGHGSVAPGDLRGQILCTRDNLRLVSEACDLGVNLGAGRAAQRHFKVYLRHAEDLEAARAELQGVLFGANDRVTWLRSDICRSELLIEIEATVVE